MIDKSSTLVDVCFAACTALARHETIAVLSGGSAATYYAPRAYQSNDADFIITFRGDMASSAAALNALGYEERAGTYHHAQSRFTLDFPRGPLSIGDEILREWETFRRESQILHVISAHDCVRDRLSAYYAWFDLSALEAAVAVALAGEVDFQELERWSDRQGAAIEFRRFTERVKRLS